MKQKLVIAMGDPSGIGPEILLQALTNPQIYEFCEPVISGNISILRAAAELLGLDIHFVPENGKSHDNSQTFSVIEDSTVNISSLQKGRISAASGQAAFNYVKNAVDYINAGKAPAIVTGPIHKESLKAASVNYIGHTEILASLTNTDDPLTMFEVKNMRIFFLSRHLSLSNAIKAITIERIIDYCHRCMRELKQLNVRSKTLAVAALNPHSSDGGLFGSEEEKIIIPAIKELQKEGLDVIGPVPADSAFHMAMQNDWGAVLSLYHDQGHIASKTYDFYRTISLTLGLPFLRTSVDHGTAFDIAWQGKANAVSMIEAIKKAIHYTK